MNNPDDYTPKYIKIQEYIINKIKSGEFQTGDKIPSENTLSEYFGVSRITANSAIKELGTMGYVERIRGKGTFVKNKIDYKSSTNFSMVFFDNIKISDVTLSSKKHTLIKKGIIQPDDELKRKFSLKENELVFELVRLMYENDIPTSIDYSYIPMSILGTQTINLIDLENKYMHHYLKNNLNKNAKYVNIYINTKILSTYELTLLNADDNNSFTAWNTDVLDNYKNVISSTTTVTKSDPTKPFISFEI